MNEALNTRGLKRKRSPLLAAVGIILCVVFSAVLVCNFMLIIKSRTNPAEPPSVLGVTPFTIQDGSMSGKREGHLEIGDLILVKQVEASALRTGDIISFASNGSVITHRIVEITGEGEQLQFITKGDASSTEDQPPVVAGQLIGRLICRIPKVGNFVQFIREPLGMMVFVLVPLILFILVDVLTRRSVVPTGSWEEGPSQLALENERLRAMLEEYKAASPSAPVQQPALQAPRPPAAQPLVQVRPVDPKAEDARAFYVGDPPRADRAVLSSIYDGQEETGAMTPPPVAEPAKAQEPKDVSLEEIMAFARSLEAKRKQ